MEGRKSTGWTQEEKRYLFGKTCWIDKCLVRSKSHASPYYGQENLDKNRLDRFLFFFPFHVDILKWSTNIYNYIQF